MKICNHCGNTLLDEAVLCPSCGCAVKSEFKPKQASYDDCVKGAATTNIISAILLALGIFCALIVNVWIGAVLCLAAEIVALVPNSKLQKALKSNNNGLDKKALKDIGKKCTKDLKAKYSGFKFSFILGYVAFACLIVFALLGNAMGI